MAFTRSPTRGKRSPWDSRLVGYATVTVGTEVTNAINVAIQLKGPNYKNLAVGSVVQAYLADDALGVVLAASAPSGGWAVGTNGLLLPVTANKHAFFSTNALGQFDVTITETTVKTFYLVLVLPDGSKQIITVAFA